MSVETGNKWLANLIQGGLLLVLLLLASYVSIGRILINNIDTYRSQIVAFVSESLAAPVQVGELGGDWAYLNPTIRIVDLAIGEQQEIFVGDLNLTLDAIASLREGVPIIRAVSADTLRLRLQKDADRWRVAGLPVSDRAFNADPILRSLDYLVGLELRGMSLEVAGQYSHFTVLSHPNQASEVRRVGEVLSLALPLQIQSDKGAQDILLAGQHQGLIGEPDSEGELFLDLPSLKITEFLLQEHVDQLRLKRVDVGGQLWLSFQGDKFDAQAQTHFALQFADAKQQFVSDQEFALEGQFGSEIVGTIARIGGEVAGVAWHFNDIGLSYEPSPDGDLLSVQIPEINIAELMTTPIELAKVGVGLKAEQLEALVALNPQGKLNSIFAIVQLGEQLDYRLVSELEGIRVERFKTLPVISDLNGLVHLGPKSGFLDMINESPFSLQFPNLFEEQWLFDEARTRFNYEVSDAGIQLQTGLVAARWGELIANGRVHIRLPGDPLETTWGLELGVQDANLLDAFRYLPMTLKKDVRSWLERSILAGRSHEAGMLFHGSLAKQAAKDQKAHQLYFEVTDTILDYDPNWPRFDELAATIFIDNFEISSDDAVGGVYGSEVFDASVVVPVSAQGVADSILIDGKVRGAFSDGVRILTETPLRDATSKVADGWVATGGMSGAAQLNIPIGQRADRGEPVWANVSVQLDGANVEMTNFDLKFDNIQGEIAYETHSALSSEGFAAELFGKPVVGSMKSLGDAEGGEIVIHMDGAVDAIDLYGWSKQPLLSKAAGTLNYESELHIFYGNRSDELLYVQATSDLAGVALTLPEPMRFSVTDTVDMSYKQTFADDHYLVDLGLGEIVSARLKVADGSAVGGRLNFGAESIEEVSYDKLKVTGELARVDYEEWDTLATDLEALSEGGLEKELEKTLDAVVLNIGIFDVFGFEMDDISTRIIRDPGYWHVDLSNSWLAGKVSVSDDDTVPLEIAMERLAFESDAESEASDPFGDVLPSDLTAARFSVADLVLDGEDYGSWSFLYQPVDDMATLSELSINVRGLQVTEDAKVYWKVEGGKHLSQFDGQVLVPDLGYALQEWGYASSIEGQDFAFYGDVSWPGSPAMVDLYTIDGLIRLMEGQGRFVQADSNMGALRLLGIFDFASLARRFRLDFSDVVKSGFSFTSIEGETRFNSGVVDVVDPIMIEGSGSTFKVAGRVDLTSRELDNDMIVTLPVNRNLPWYAAYSAFATGLWTGAGVFLAQKVFQNQINAISSAKYKITGTMEEPIIEFVTIFSDSVREAPAIPPTGE